MTRFLTAALFTIVLIWALDRSWLVGGNRLPPPGRFLDPFHGLWRNAEGPQPEFNSSVIPGLQQPVTIHFDSAMIPHIYAANDADLYRAQGYVAALLRLWQMEFQIHAAAGRLSEVVGARALEYDRSQRRFGMVYAAENAFEALKDNELAVAMANHYAEGVNAYIESLNYESLPFEYKLLDYSPEGWTPFKSAMLLKSMSQTLAASNKDVGMTNALKLFEKDTLDMLFPDRETVGDPVVSKPGEWTRPSGTVSLGKGSDPSDCVWISNLPENDPTVGSNNWAVAGSKTASGDPILCNDPHLNTTLPSLWLTMHLNAPGINCLGVTLPGAPNVIIGFNDSIAWGMTNAQRDLVDWYRIESDGRDHYSYEGGRRPFRKKIEEIKVRGEANFYDTVLYTHHGPIVYDKSFQPDNGRTFYAYRWVAHEDSATRGEDDAEIVMLYKLNRARNHADYMDALNHFASPPQNFVFASVTGDIAIRIQGRFPLREAEKGRFVLDGTRRSEEWHAFIPYDQNVTDKNPLHGFVSSANQYPADSTYPYYVTAQSYEAYRNRRINQVLQQKNAITPQDMMDLQNDNFNLKAYESLPFFIGRLTESNLNQEEMAALEILKSWDYVQNESAEGASYFEAWWRSFMSLLWDEMRIENGPPLPTPTSYQTIYLIKSYPNLRFYDIASTPHSESLSNVLHLSFAEGVKAVQEWKKEKGLQQARWADYKDTYVPHLLRIEPLGVHVQHGGGSSTVNASTRTHGPSWRMVVSLEKSGVKAWGVYPGGQSGNPGSSYYASWLPLWENAQYFKLGFWSDATDARNNAMTTIELTAR